jgi:hypothetical protein
MLLAYAPAFLAALLKDLLDLVGIGSLPAIGTVLTLCFSLLIFLLLWAFAGTSRKSHGAVRSGVLKSGKVLLAGTIVESLFFGLNFLPIETLTVYIIYRMDKKRRREAMDEEVDAVPAY